MVSNDTPRSWVNECRHSVRAAIERCAYSIRAIEVPGLPGHIGHAMMNALKHSSADYVAWVDDDDFVLPNAFTCLERHFTARPTAICARECNLLANGRLVPQKYRHHLTAWRRDFLDTMPLMDHPAYTLVSMFRALSMTDAVDEWSWVYVRRIRRSGGMTLRGIHGFGC